MSTGHCLIYEELCLSLCEQIFLYVLDFFTSRKLLLWFGVKGHFHITQISPQVLQSALTRRISEQGTNSKASMRIKMYALEPPLLYNVFLLILKFNLGRDLFSQIFNFQIPMNFFLCTQCVNRSSELFTRHSIHYPGSVEELTLLLFVQQF